MRMISSPLRRGGVVANIVMVLMVLVVIYFYVNRDTTPTPKQAARAIQQDPEKALVHYLTVAYKFMIAEEGGSFEDVREAISVDDWNWFQDNYQSLHADPFDIGGGLDPTTAAALSRRSALHGLFAMGPNRPDVEIVDRQIGADEVVFRVKYRVQDDYFNQSDVRVVNEGGRWRVSGFAGARAMSEGGGAGLGDLLGGDDMMDDEDSTGTLGGAGIQY
jgi:hypothetical protein